MPQSDKATQAIVVDSDSPREKVEEQVKLAEQWREKEKQYASRIRELEFKIAHQEQEH